jgi:hypothetical protein
MSGAVGALLCCCTEPEVCGSCFLRYRILWTGSIELLATCCPVIYCPDADTQAGQFTNKCDPCEWIINYGGNPCQGDCGRDGCYVATYDGQIGPLAIEIAAGGMAPPCIYQGIDTGGFEIMACCPPDPALPFCSSGQVGDISWSVSVQMMRGGFGLPPEDWVVQLRVIIATGPNSCYGDSVHEATFHAPNSGNLCPHEASFIPVANQTSGFEASQLDPCNQVLSYCLTINVHAADIGTVQAIQA